VAEFLDTEGQEEFQALRPQWISYCEGAVIGYAINARQSFKEAQVLYELVLQVKQAGPKQIPIVLMGSVLVAR